MKVKLDFYLDNIDSVWKVHCEEFVTADEFKEVFENSDVILKFFEDHGFIVLGAVICKNTKRVHFVVSEASKALHATILSIWTTEID